MERLDDILELLSSYEEITTQNYGLYHGRSGLAMVYFVIYTITGEKKYFIKGQNLIEELTDNISNVEGLDLDKGLAGIGWAVEWFIENKFVEGNSDELLEDLDDELYKRVIYSKSENLSLENGTIGKALYFYKRLCAKNPNVSRFRNLCNQESLVLLIDEIGETLLSEENEISLNNGNQGLSCNEISQTLIFLSTINHLKINIEISKVILCAINKFIKHVFLTDKFESVQTDTEIIYLIYACFKAGKTLNDDDFLSMAKKAFQSICPIFIVRPIKSAFGRLILHRLAQEFDFHFEEYTLNQLNLTPDSFSLLASLSIQGEIDVLKWEGAWGL